MRCCPNCCFEDAIRNAISVGGDSDTLAAITGGVAEAYYGVPEAIKNKAKSYLDKTLLSIFKDYETFQNKKSPCNTRKFE